MACLTVLSLTLTHFSREMALVNLLRLASNSLDLLNEDGFHDRSFGLSGPPLHAEGCFFFFRVVEMIVFELDSVDYGPRYVQKLSMQLLRILIPRTN